MTQRFFLTTLKITPAPDGVHCGDCKWQDSWTMGTSWRCTHYSDVCLDGGAEPERCDTCLYDEKKWQNRADLVYQCGLCKDWDDHNICSCCGNRFFPDGYLPLTVPVLVPCPDCQGSWRRVVDEAHQETLRHPCSKCVSTETPGWVPLVPVKRK